MKGPRILTLFQPRTLNRALNYLYSYTARVHNNLDTLLSSKGFIKGLKTFPVPSRPLRHLTKSRGQATLYTSDTLNNDPVT